MVYLRSIEVALGWPVNGLLQTVPQELDVEFTGSLSTQGGDQAGLNAARYRGFGEDQALNLHS